MPHFDSRLDMLESPKVQFSIGYLTTAGRLSRQSGYPSNDKVWMRFTHFCDLYSQTFPKVQVRCNRELCFILIHTKLYQCPRTVWRKSAILILKYSEAELESVKSTNLGWKPKTTHWKAKLQGLRQHNAVKVMDCLAYLCPINQHLWNRTWGSWHLIRRGTW